MVIGIIGYGYSGSGAVLDFLREFEACSCPLVDGEFELPYIPHGIQDLEYQLMERKTRYLSSHMAIKDFLRLIRGMDSPRSCYRKKTGSKFRERSYAFIREITQISWRGYAVPDRWRERSAYGFMMGQKWKIMRSYERLTGRRWKFSKRDIMYLSVAPENFYDSAKRYLRDVLEMLGSDFDKRVLLNQPFDAYDPRRSMKFFDDPKAILVDRDPRDVYVLAKFYLKSEGSFIPTSNVDDYIKYYRLVRNENMANDPNIIHIQYEDLVYDYEKTAERIADFLDLPLGARDAKKYFNPEVSLNNTQLFLKHPQLTEDIHRIEEKLTEYIYAFEKFNRKPSDSNKKPF